jgi:methyl-accepting chemotaxis protein
VFSPARPFLVNRSVRTRLAGVLASSLAALLSVTVVSVQALDALHTATSWVVGLATLTHEIDMINYYNADMSGWLASFAWDADFMGGAKAVDPKAIDRAGFLAHEPLLQHVLDIARTGSMTKTETALFDDMKQQWAQFFQLDGKIVAICHQNTLAAVLKARGVIQKDQYAIYFKIAGDAQKLSTSVQARRATEQAAAQQAAPAARTATLVAAMIGLLVAAGVTWPAIRSVAGPLRKVSYVVAGLAEGDLTRSAGVTSHDEIGTTAQGLDAATGRCGTSSAR